MAGSVVDYVGKRITLKYNPIAQRQWLYTTPLDKDKLGVGAAI
jgi:hypothetical protein